MDKKQSDKEALDKLKGAVKQPELYTTVLMFLEHTKSVLGDVQTIMEYCGFNEEGAEVVGIAVVALPIFDTFTFYCTDGKVTMVKGVE